MTGSTAQLPTSVDGRHWHCLDVVSDLHLQASEPATWQAFEQYLKSTPAQALFILGDLFEVWIGDDVLDHPLGAWEQGCVAALAKAAERLELFWIPGNRDFLTGDAFASRCAVVRLDDPCQLLLPSETCLLSRFCQCYAKALLAPCASKAKWPRGRNPLGAMWMMRPPAHGYSKREQPT